MQKFTDALLNWASDSFKPALKHEIESLKTGTLPLEKGLSQGGHIDDNDITATILSVSDNQLMIEAKVGIFFTEIVGGCNCNDDPMEINAYCEMKINIDKQSAEADIVAIET